METAQQILAHNCRRRRMELALRQADLAELAGVQPNYISLIEQRKTWPSPAVLKNLARALKTTQSALFLDPDLDFTLADLAEIVSRMARKQKP